ncbi:MAG: HAMP domain-containing sensor histidine kinase [Acidobacteriota bacterium]
MPSKRKGTISTKRDGKAPTDEQAGAPSRHDLEFVMRDLREANEHLVLANIRSQALAGEIRLLYEEATEVIEAKDAFFAQISHDLRTPLTSITGWAALLGVNPDPATIAEAARSIASSAALQAKLVNDLLDISRIMTYKFEIISEAIDLRKVADDAASAIRPLAAAKSIALGVNFSPGLVDGDAIRLRQVVDNLLSNAVKFTSPGGAIETTLTFDGTDAVLQVRDDGEGIPSNFMPHIFKRHAQAGGSRFGGLGLGLAIAKYIVELHGGTVVAESEGEGKGATFTIRLPARRPDGRPDSKSSLTGA